MLKGFLSLLILPIFLQAHSDVVSGIYSTTQGTITFRSDAPLELIRASSKQLHGKIDSDKKQFAFRIRVSTFQGFNSPLQQEHFNENYLESDRYPYATFAGKLIEDIDYTMNGTYTVRAKGNLTIHNVTQERIIKSELTVNNGVLSIHSTFTVLLSEHNIPIPKVVHEKLASEIKVEVKADLRIE
jgi:polyisoprenoid-binding protein YceI